MSEGSLQIEKAVYGGNGLARGADGKVALLPFTLPGEVVESVSDAATTPAASLRILQASRERVQPLCVHFGVCGGCQYQMANYPAQVAMKTAILHETLDRAGVTGIPEVRAVPSPEPWGYRNRIRLRVHEVGGYQRLGYNLRGSNEFLPIRMCPIAAPVLWWTAEALVQLAARHDAASEWLREAAEVEIACDDQAAAIQVHLLTPRSAPQRIGNLQLLAEGLLASGVPIVSVVASRFHSASGRAEEELAHWGARGFTYSVGEDRFWVKPGGFFQVNRFLLPAMVEIVCGHQRGRLAWDLYAGVGLFSRSLGRQFEAVTAVEANPEAEAELRRGLRRPDDHTATQTTQSFLRSALLQRDRPELIVLDPPRAGAGEEVCRLLLQMQPSRIVYVSCDPTTLGRDLRVLTTLYRVAEMHMVDLFPQTYHLETVMVLQRLV